MSTTGSPSGMLYGPFMADELGPALSQGKRELRCEPFAASRGPKLNPRLLAPKTEAEREMRRAWPGSFSSRQRTLYSNVQSKIHTSEE
jgi:hypothetical protein